MKKNKTKSACCPACAIPILQALEAKNVEIVCPRCNTPYIININRHGVNMTEKKKVG